MGWKFGGVAGLVMSTGQLEIEDSQQKFQPVVFFEDCLVKLSIIDCTCGVFSTPENGNI